MNNKELTPCETNYAPAPDSLKELLRIARGLIRLRQPCERCKESGKEPNNPKDACHSCGGMGEHCDAAELLQDAREVIKRFAPDEVLHKLDEKLSKRIEAYRQADRW